MPRNAAGQFYLPPGTEAVRDEVAYSEHINERFDAFAYDANVARPITAGGAGANSAAKARQNLGITPEGLGVVAAGRYAPTPQDHRCTWAGDINSLVIASPTEGMNLAAGVGIQGNYLREAQIGNDGITRGDYLGASRRWKAISRLDTGKAGLFIRIE